MTERKHPLLLQCSLLAIVFLVLVYLLANLLSYLLLVKSGRIGGVTRVVKLGFLAWASLLLHSGNPANPATVMDMVRWLESGMKRSRLCLKHFSLLYSYCSMSAEFLDSSE